MTLKISKWLFLLLVISLPLVRPFNIQLFGLLVPFTDFIFLPAFGFWGIALWRRETSFKFDKFFIYLALYAFSLTVSTIFSIDPTLSFFKLLGEFYLFALAGLTFNLAAEEKRFFKQIVFAWLIGTGLTILAALAGVALFYLGYKTQAENYFLSHFGSLPAGNYPRIHALFANANMMCNFLNLSLMLALLAEKLNWLRKMWARVLQAGIWLAAFFTFSAGLGGMLLSAGIWFWMLWTERKNRLFAGLSMAAGICSAAFFFGAVLISTDTENTKRDFSLPFLNAKFETSVRVLTWQSALETFYQFPLVGKGTGTDAAFVAYETLSGDRQILLDAHNSWLNVLAQTGFLGIIAFLSLNVYLITKCRFKPDESREQPLIHIALSCALLGAFFYQGFSGSFEDARHLWILMGLLVAVSHRNLPLPDFNSSENDILEASKEP